MRNFLRRVLHTYVLPSPREIAIAQLENAKRLRLDALIELEHWQSAVNQYEARILRLEAELRSPKEGEQLLLDDAVARLRDMLKGDDGQAWKEAQKFLDIFDRIHSR